MKCPRCGSRTGITDTRLRKSGEVHRRRICAGKRCAFRFTTREVLRDALNDLKAQANSMRGVAKALAVYDR